ncbi:MAG: type II toxin-antitoxin system HicA family toxin [Deltaproteobacteria bacterium]|nr:type II toxin-antitoxin system HicA family toxin [Deltaproteobacteria bacterium]
MGKYEKLYEHILMRRSDANVPFDSLCFLLKKLGFDERIKGDHHIFTRDDVEEILNMQPMGDKGKPYQVKQVRDIILKYQIHIGE